MQVLARKCGFAAGSIMPGSTSAVGASRFAGSSCIDTQSNGTANYANAPDCLTDLHPTDRDVVAYDGI